MKIKFSRHAKRRLKLYKISELAIKEILTNINLPQGKHEIIRTKEKMMKIYYDNEVDALYIKLSNKKPDGVVEISEGVNLDTTIDGKIVGIEILDASKKMDLKTILTYTLEIDKKRLLKKIA